jgi:hypothetical protein
MKMKDPFRFSTMVLLVGLCLVATIVSAKEAVAPAPAKSPTFADQVDRWFDSQQLQISTRYRIIETSAGATASNQWQYKQSYKFRFKFDPKGKYTVNAGVFTGGTSFTGSWNNTGVGKTGTKDDLFQRALYFKQFYFEAKPVKGLEIQFGGLYFIRGEGTEAISYDNDGFIMGERISLKRPKDLFFDEISATFAYLGDLTKPDVFGRFKRLEKSNYHQFLVGKKIGKRAGVSADYSFQSGIETLRQAIKVSAKELKFIDSILFENYERVDVKPDYGLNVMVEKALNKRLNIGPGFATVDRNYGALNGDFYARGNRFYLLATIVLTPEFSLSTQFTRAFHNDFTVANRTRFDIALNYNLLKTLQKAHILKSPPKK